MSKATKLPNLSAYPRKSNCLLTRIFLVGSLSVGQVSLTTFTAGAVTYSTRTEGNCYYQLQPIVRAIINWSGASSSTTGQSWGYLYEWDNYNERWIFRKEGYGTGVGASASATGEAKGVSKAGTYTGTGTHTTSFLTTFRYSEGPIFYCR